MASFVGVSVCVCACVFVFVCTCVCVRMSGVAMMGRSSNKAMQQLECSPKYPYCKPKALRPSSHALDPQP